jgi:hypothetical protein
MVIRACIMLSLLSMLGAVECAGGGSDGSSAVKPPDAVPRHFVSSRPAPTARLLATALRRVGIHVRTAGGNVIVEASNEDSAPTEGTLEIVRGGLDPSMRVGPLHPVVPCSLPALSGLYADRVMLEYWPGYRKDDGSCEPSARGGEAVAEREGRHGRRQGDDGQREGFALSAQAGFGA